MVRSPEGRRLPGLLDVADFYGEPAFMEVVAAADRATHYAAMQHPMKDGG
jgi:hypothetical protein